MVGGYCWASRTVRRHGDDGGDDGDGDGNVDDVQTRWGIQQSLSYCVRRHCVLRLQLEVQCQIQLVQCVGG